MLFTNTRQLGVTDMSATYSSINNCAFLVKNAKLKQLHVKKDSNVNA